MLVEKVKKYSHEKYDLNCAEIMLNAANEEYNLGLDKKALKLMAGFGGGMGIEGTCGVISGAIAALSTLFVEDRAHESDEIKKLTSELICRFKEKLGTDECHYLKKKVENEEMKCKLIIYEGAEILQELINEKLKSGVM